MQKIGKSKPILIYFYGMPGAGKTLFSQNLSKDLGMAHISSDRIRSFLFAKQTRSKSENTIVTNLMDMFTEQFLKLGVSVLYDISANRLINRKSLKEFAKKYGAKDLLIWLQIDQETAKFRSQHRDKRRQEDKYNNNLDDSIFNQQIEFMQNPTNEDPVVISGKHHYGNQKNAIIKRLVQDGLVDLSELNKKIAKPELVNLVNRAQVQSGRVNLSRRNILIR